MSKEEFDDFLRKEEEQKQTTIDWEDRKKWWLMQLNILFSDIQNWLKEYIDSKKINVEFNYIDIYEEILGSYKAQQMRIKINDKIATLTPFGTILIGTNGRVDMTGNVDRVRFILTDRNAKGIKIESKLYFSDEHKRKEEEKKPSQPQIDWVWKITTNPPKIKYSDLNQDSFLECLVQVCNGK